MWGVCETILTWLYIILGYILYSQVRMVSQTPHNGQPTIFSSYLNSSCGRVTPSPTEQWRAATKTHFSLLLPLLQRTTTSLRNGEIEKRSMLMAELHCHARMHVPVVMFVQIHNVRLSSTSLNLRLRACMVRSGFNCRRDLIECNIKHWMYGKALHVE